jgi:hypothetical protein
MRQHQATDEDDVTEKRAKYARIGAGCASVLTTRVRFENGPIGAVRSRNVQAIFT